MKIHLSPALKLYLKSIPKVALAALLGSWIVFAVTAMLISNPSFTTLKIISSYGFIFTVISLVLMCPATLLIYLPSALYFRNYKYRAVSFPILGMSAYATFPIWMHLAGESSLGRTPFFFWIALAIGFCVGLIHHFLMRRE